MNTQTKVLTVIMLALILGPFPVFADTTTTKTTVTTTTYKLKPAVPIYTGTVADSDLEALTPEDFQKVSEDEARAAESYARYQAELKNQAAAERLYKMKVQRPLVLADFEGPGIAPELAQSRYTYYTTSIEPTSAKYVYVYRRPVASTVAVKN